MLCSVECVLGILGNLCIDHIYTRIVLRETLTRIMLNRIKAKVWLLICSMLNLQVLRKWVCLSQLFIYLLLLCVAESKCEFNTINHPMSVCCYGHCVRVNLYNHAYEKLVFFLRCTQIKNQMLTVAALYHH